jgi:hypothetical protein
MTEHPNGAEPYVGIPEAVRLTGFADVEILALNRADVVEAKSVGGELRVSRADLDRVMRTLRTLAEAMSRGARR